MYVAAAAEHAGAERVEHGEWQAQREVHEVGAGVATDVVAPSQPVRKVVADADAYAAKQKREQNARQETLSQHLTRADEVACPYLVCHLHVETHTGRRTETAEQPYRGTHQTDARTGLCAKAAHHGGIDVLHHDVHQLRHHAGETKQGGKLDLR